MLLKYNTAAVVTFPVIKAGTSNLAGSADWTPASGDVYIIKDGGTPATTTNLPTAAAMGNGAVWKLSLTATELAAKEIVITIADATTKAVEDQVVRIDTYGDGNGQVDVRTHADALLNRDMSVGTDSVARSPRNALRFLRNKWSIAGGVLTVTKENDTTSAWTSTLTTTSTADAITGSDPA